MKKVLVAIVLIGSLAAASGDCSSDTEEKATVATTEPSGEQRESQPATPEPDGDYELNCDYVLGDFGESGDPAKGFRFVAGGTVANTGNVGIVARVRVRWQQLGVAPVLEERTVRLPAGKTKRVNISRPATSDEIDLHQSADAECQPNVKIVDTFGRVSE